MKNIIICIIINVIEIQDILICIINIVMFIIINVIDIKHIIIFIIILLGPAARQAWAMGWPRAPARAPGCCHLVLGLAEALACRHLALSLPRLEC
jgi:hypothetical protein